MPALCPIHVRKSRAQWSPAAEFYGFFQFIISFMFISGVSDVSRWFVMAFGFAILICSSFFEGWASRVPGAQLIPPSYSAHVVPFGTAGASPVRQCQAAQAGAQWKRLLVHSKAWKSGKIPWHVGTFLFLSILSITGFKCKLNCLNNCLKWKLLPLDPPKLDLA